MKDASNEANWNGQHTLPDRVDTLNLDNRKKAILQALPDLEGCQSIETMVHLADGILENNYGQGKNPGERKMLCSRTADILKVEADISENWETSFPEISQINYFRGVEFNDSFYDHTPVIMTNKTDGKKYIVDLTFSQFVDPETKEIVYKNIDDEEISTSISSETEPLVRELLVNGYVDYESLDDYLNLMVKPEARVNKGQKFWDEYYGQMEMESFSTNDDIDRGCKEIEVFLRFDTV